MSLFVTTPEVILQFPTELIERCVETARRCHDPNNLVDLHYCHTPIGTLCVVLHAPVTGLPIQVLTEIQGQELGDRAKQVIKHKQQRSVTPHLSEGTKILGLTDAAIKKFVDDALALWTDRTRILRHFCTFPYSPRQVTLVVLLYPSRQYDPEVWVKEEMEAIETAFLGAPRSFIPKPDGR